MKENLTESRILGVKKISTLRPTLRISVLTSAANNSSADQHNAYLAKRAFLEAERKKATALIILRRHAFIC